MDLALLVTRETMNQQKTEHAIRTTFDLRQTDAIAESLMRPPDSWEFPFRTMAEECNLDQKMQPTEHKLSYTPDPIDYFWNSLL